MTGPSDQIETSSADNHFDPTDCPDCDGFGAVYNNADPTSGQHHQCETCNDDRYYNLLGV